MNRFALLSALLLSAAVAHADGARSIDGIGRITVQGGYRWTPNNYFNEKASAAGHPVTRASPGGPQVSASFGYGATDFIEGTIDLIFGYESFTLKNLEPFNSFTYGALLGVRFAKMDFPIRGLLPHVGAQMGPILGFVSSPSNDNQERLTTGYSFNAGLSWRFTERFGLTFDTRFLVARAYVNGISGINVGGLFFSLGFTVFFAPSPKTALDNLSL